MTKTKEQLEEEKKISLSIRIKPLELDGKTVHGVRAGLRIRSVIGVGYGPGFSLKSRTKILLCYDKEQISRIILTSVSIY